MGVRFFGIQEAFGEAPCAKSERGARVGWAPTVQAGFGEGAVHSWQEFKQRPIALDLTGLYRRRQTCDAYGHDGGPLVLSRFSAKVTGPKGKEVFPGDEDDLSVTFREVRDSRRGTGVVGMRSKHLEN